MAPSVQMQIKRIRALYINLHKTVVFAVFATMSFLKLLQAYFPAFGLFAPYLDLACILLATP